MLKAQKTARKESPPHTQSDTRRFQFDFNWQTATRSRVLANFMSQLNCVSENRA